MKATEFQGDLRIDLKKGRIPKEAADLLLTFNFPQYIWVSEIFSKGSGGRETCVAKFILDSTAAHSDRSIMVVMLKDLLVLFDRQNLNASASLQPLTASCQFTPRQNSQFVESGG
jgi:hypothetical protein